MALPYENATSGDKAIGEIQKMLRAFGCQRFATGDDYESSELFVQFEHHGRMVQLKASARGYAAAWLKVHPKYRHPVTRKEHSMGKDKAKAFAAAKKLNALLMPDSDLVSRVLTPGETVADAIKVFRADDIPGRKWAPKTAEVYESVIRRIEAKLGEMAVADVSVKACATFIREVTDSERARQQFRLVLGWILACAVEEGWIATNPALATRKFSHSRKRERLTIDVYGAIWDAAAQWLRNAMALSLLTLLRREDVVSARFADVRDGSLWVVPSKTEDSTSVRLQIAVAGPLEGLISACRDDVVSPFLIHRLPEKARPSNTRKGPRAPHPSAAGTVVARLRHCSRRRRH